MVEPTSALVSGVSRALIGAVTKQLLSQIGTKLGGRDERRQVYARFLDATVEGMVHARFLRTVAYVVYPRWISPGKSYHVAETSHRVLRAMLQAYMDLRVAANPDPIEKADRLLERVTDLIETAAKKGPDSDMAMERAGRAQRAFVDTARDDLGYLPRKWQIYRPRWWAVGYRNLRRRLQLRSAAS